MNVIIKKQCDKTLFHTDHAILRAEERNIPLPKYIPLNAELIRMDVVDGTLCYRLRYDYVGKKYTMVVTKNMVLKTVYVGCPPVHEGVSRLQRHQISLKQYQRNLRQNMTREYYTQKAGKYKHMEFDVEYESYYLCA